MNHNNRKINKCRGHRLPVVLSAEERQSCHWPLPDPPLADGTVFNRLTTKVLP